MKRILLIVTLCLTISSYSQVQEAWTYPTLGFIYSSPSNACLVVDGNENIYTGTHTFDFGPGIGLERTMMIKKFNSSGTELFSILEPVESFNRTLIDMAVDAAGNIYCAVLISVSLDPSVGRSGGLFAVYKYSSSGSVVWKRTYGDGEYSSPSALALDAAGNVYVTGGCKESGLPGPDQNLFDYLTVKWSSNGDLLWAKRYDGASPGEGFNFANDIVVDGSGNAYITGASQRDGVLNYATIKYDASGNEKWVQRYNGLSTEDDRALAIAIDLSGFVYVTGRSEGSMATVKYNNDGGQLWVSRKGTVGAEGREIKVDAFGGVYVAGSTTATQMALVKYGFTGAELWAVTRNNSQAHSLAVDGSGNAYVGGTSNDDGIVIKYSSLGVEQWFKTHDSPLLDGVDAPVAVTPNENVYVESFISTSRDGNAQARYVSSLIKYTQCTISMPVTRIEVNTEPGQCGATVNWEASVKGDCGEVVYEDANGTVYTPGSFLSSGQYNLKAISHSSGAEVAFSISVIDREAPGITNCPVSKTLNTDPGVCYATSVSVSAGVAKATDNCGVTITGTRSDGKNLTDHFPVGITTITWKATDASGNSDVCTQTITVVDNEPPSITGESASTYVLSPANHKMRNVTINYTVMDNCNVSTSLSVTSNEPVNGTGDGDTAPDWVIVDNHTVQLRAERAATGNGRIYTITITAVDPAGNSSSKTIEVNVPHDNRKTDSTPLFTQQFSETASEENTVLNVTAYPNPAAAKFIVFVSGFTAKEKTVLQVMDMFGRVIENRILTGNTIQLGENYRPGTYLLRVLQGQTSKEIKIIKLSN